MTEAVDSILPKANKKELHTNESEEEDRFSFNSHHKARDSSILSKTNDKENRNQTYEYYSSFESNQEGGVVANEPPPYERWRHVAGNEITDNDIVLGRGIGKSHAGNIKFRGLIRQHKYEYLRAPKVSKPRVAEKIVRIWREMGGRFLARKDTVGTSAATISDIRKEIWYDVGDKRAREKSSMSLREKTPDMHILLERIKRDENELNHGELIPTMNKVREGRHPLTPPRNPPPPIAAACYRYDGNAPLPIEVPRRGGPQMYSTYAPHPLHQNIRGSQSDYALSAPQDSSSDEPTSPSQPGRRFMMLPPSSRTWRDYSSSRSRPRSPYSSTTRVLRERELSPAPTDDARQVHKPRSLFEAQLQAELKAIRMKMEDQNKEIQEQSKQIKEQSKHIEDLMKKLQIAHLDSSGNGENDKSQSSTEKFEVASTQTSPPTAAAVGDGAASLPRPDNLTTTTASAEAPSCSVEPSSLMLSPVPYQQDEENTGENYEAIMENRWANYVLLDCFRQDHESSIGGAAIEIDQSSNLSNDGTIHPQERYYSRFPRLQPRQPQLSETKRTLTWPILNSDLEKMLDIAPHSTTATTTPPSPENAIMITTATREPATTTTKKQADTPRHCRFTNSSKKSSRGENSSKTSSLGLRSLGLKRCKSGSWGSELDGRGTHLHLSEHFSNHSRENSNNKKRKTSMISTATRNTARSPTTGLFNMTSV